jgi:hypothetical protein
MAVQFEVHRVRTDEAGESHFDAYKVTRGLKEYAALPVCRALATSVAERASPWSQTRQPWPVTPLDIRWRSPPCRPGPALAAQR